MNPDFIRRLAHFRPKDSKIRATLSDDKNGKTDVLLQMQHPMDSGRVYNARGELIPSHFIWNAKIFHGDKLLIDAKLNFTISTNPKWRFSFLGGKIGDEITILWYDNRGFSQKTTASIT